MCIKLRVLNRPPYEQIALPLADELQAAGRSRSVVAETLGVPLATLNNVLAGWRRPTAQVLNHLLFLAHQGNFARYSERSRFYSDAYGIQAEAPEAGAVRRTPAAAGAVSRTHRIRLGRKPLRIGILDFAPWASAGAPRPSGLVPDLLDVLTDSMGIACAWSVLSLTRLVDAVVNGDVDVAAGFICRTPFRTTRTVFVPLGLPVQLGIQAITRAPVPPGNYAETRQWVERSARAGALHVVMVEGELSWEYRRSLLAPETPIQTESGEIEDAVERNWDREDVVIFTDHVTAGQVAGRSRAMGDRRPFHSVYGLNTGSFTGGFLLPVNDREFLKFFELSWEHLMTSRMPIVGETIARYASEMAPFLKSDLSGPKNCPRGLKWRNHLAPAPATMFAWMTRHWPPQVPVPDAWSDHLAAEQRHLEMRTARLRNTARRAQPQT